MHKQKLGFIALTILLACAQATAGDPAPAAKDGHAAPAKESPKEAAPAKAPTMADEEMFDVLVLCVHQLSTFLSEHRIVVLPVLNAH